MDILVLIYNINKTNKMYDQLVRPLIKRKRQIKQRIEK